jgi:hypothetical protein
VHNELVFRYVFPPRQVATRGLLHSYLTEAHLDPTRHRPNANRRILRHHNGGQQEGDKPRRSMVPHKGHQSLIQYHTGGDRILHATKDSVKLQSHTSGADPHIHRTRLPRTHPIRIHHRGLSRYLHAQALRVMSTLQRTRRYGNTTTFLLYQT